MNGERVVTVECIALPKLSFLEKIIFNFKAMQIISCIPKGITIKEVEKKNNGFLVFEYNREFYHMPIEQFYACTRKVDENAIHDDE